MFRHIFVLYIGLYRCNINKVVKSGERCLMLIGEYKQKLGDKNRVALPNKLRLGLNSKNVIATRGYENCLVLMSPAQWEKLIETEVSTPFVLSATRDTSRFLLASATKIVFDSQGRFVVPQYLCDHAKLVSEVVFLGLGRWIEVWSSKLWTQKLEYLSKSGSGIAEKLASLKTE